MIAGFHLDWDHNVLLTMKHCNAAAALEPSPDEAVRSRIIRAAALAHEAASVVGAAAANTQVAFRRHTADADAAVLALARGKQRLFAGLRAAAVDMSSLLAVSRDIMAAYSSATENYRAALRLLPSSIGTMRSYAAVLRSVHDAQAAAPVLAAADALEETLMKKSAAVYRHVAWAMPTNFDVALESNGVITVSIDPRNIGSVLTANAEACRLFGYPHQVCALTAGVSVVMTRAVH